MVGLALLPRTDLGLSRGARLVLVGMAALAKDSDPEPVYFGGWHWLAGVLGYDVFTSAAHRAVARSIQELRDAKLIEPMNASGPGERVGYRLHVSLSGSD